MSLEDIVDRVVNQSQSIEINCELVLDHNNDALKIHPRSSKHDYHRKPTTSPSHDYYKTINDERNRALEQVERLTTELKEVKYERNMLEKFHRKDEKKRLRILQNQMKVVIKDRDKAVELSAKLENEMKRFRMKQNNKNDAFLRIQTNLELDEYKARLEENEMELLETQSSHDELHNKFNELVDDNNQLIVQLQEAIEKSTEDKKRSEKLERLLIALRRRKER